MRNAQQLFDTVVSHLRKQGEKSVKDFDGKDYTCVYRSADGKQCAVGCLIPESDYNPEFEEKRVSHLLEAKILPARVHNEFFASRGLLVSLQAIHDLHDVNLWESLFASLAIRLNLVYIKP